MPKGPPGIFFIIFFIFFYLKGREGAVRCRAEEAPCASRPLHEVDVSLWAIRRVHQRWLQALGFHLYYLN